MATTEPFEPHAALNHNSCPVCGAMCAFSMDFKKLGAHQLRVCLPCGGVYLDGKIVQPLLMPGTEVVD